MEEITIMQEITMGTHDGLQAAFSVVGENPSCAALVTRESPARICIAVLELSNGQPDAFGQWSASW